LCTHFKVCVENTQKLVELVETTIDFESRDHHITIKAEFDSSLQEIAKKLEKTKNALNKQFEDTADELGFDTSNPKKCPLNFENHQVYGHCFRLTRKVSTAYGQTWCGAILIM
jgi:DNA mismatch repair protein MSH2